MAAITGTGSFGRARWILGALLRQLHSAEKDTAAVDPASVRPRTKRHSYPQRNQVFERAAMAREMYRL